MDLLGKSNDYFFHNCYFITKNKKEMPALSTKNGLYVDEIPTELQSILLDNQCIAINVLFMKMNELPKT